MDWWALPILLIAAGLAGYVWGVRRGSRAWREEQRQRAIEARLLGREPRRPAATSERAVIRKARLFGTHAWRR